MSKCQGILDDYRPEGLMMKVEEKMICRETRMFVTVIHQSHVGMEGG